MAFVGGRIRRRSYRRRANPYRRRATRSRLGKAFSGVERGFGSVLGTVGLQKPANFLARTVRVSRGGDEDNKDKGSVFRVGGTGCTKLGGRRSRKHRTRRHKRKCH